MQSVIFLSIIVLFVVFCIYTLIHHKTRAKQLQNTIIPFEESKNELNKMEHEAKVDDLADDIRCVVLCTIDLIKEPYPYRIKKDVPYIKEAHNRILSIRGTSIYKDAVKLADHNIFECEFPELENKEYRKFFDEYVFNPDSYNLSRIKQAIPQKYLDELEDVFAEL